MTARKMWQSPPHQAETAGPQPTTSRRLAPGPAQVTATGPRPAPGLSGLGRRRARCYSRMASVDDPAGASLASASTMSVATRPAPRRVPPATAMVARVSVCTTTSLAGFASDGPTCQHAEGTATAGSAAVSSCHQSRQPLDHHFIAKHHACILVSRLGREALPRRHGAVHTDTGLGDIGDRYP
jgi:hypothetical protein